MSPSQSPSRRHAASRQFFLSSLIAVLAFGMAFVSGYLFGRADGGPNRSPIAALLEPLERLGDDERDGDEVDDDGRLAPCDGALGRVVVELPVPVLVDGLVWVDVPVPVLLPVLLPEVPVDGATASVSPAPEDRLGAEPVAPDPELGRVEPWPGVDGRCWVTVCPVRVCDGGLATR